MPTIIKKLYKELTNQLIHLKTDKDEDKDFIDNFLKTIRYLSYCVYNKNIDMRFLNKLEAIKQYRQSVMNNENFNFFITVIFISQTLQIMTMGVVFEKNPQFLSES